jgi:hypothetical protein
MNRLAGTYSILAGVLMVAISAFGVDKKPSKPVATARVAPPVGAPAVDPLGLPADLELITTKSPQAGVIGTGTPKTGEATAAGTLKVSTLVFRVQIYTAQGFADARKAAQVAEEIFDQPVHIDYEIPNFKVRVGDFAMREDANDYRRLALSMGYANPWVVSVTVGVNEAAPLYDSTAIPANDSAAKPDTDSAHAGPR